MDIKGKVKLIEETQTFGSGFTKRSFVITTNDKYPQDIKFDCIKDKIELLNSLREGDDVNVDFNIRGNEYKDRYYVNLEAWRIAKESGGSAPAPATNNESSQAQESQGGDDLEDSPF